MRRCRESICKIASKRGVAVEKAWWRVGLRRGARIGCVKIGRKFRGRREMELHKLDGRRT